MNAPTPGNSNTDSSRWLHDSSILAAVLIAWLVTAVASQIAYRPPTPKSKNVASDEFSAARASDYHQLLFADGIAHNSGSAQNKIVGNRIVGLLKQFGYQAEIQSSEQEIRFKREDNEAEKVIVSNVIAVKKGDPELGKVMLVAHYDSVPYGPGASDDGVAVAVNLEIAKMAKAFIPAGREVVFLFTDGEEYGLLGALAFVNENELAKDIEFVINLEARGTTGASLMFQSSSDSMQMVRLLASSLDRPVTSSVFEEVYKRLPRDTDFTVFRDQGGMRGFNFAFIGGARKYHTAEDTVENSDPGSMQHHGDNAWAVMQTLVRLPEVKRQNENAVYFDVFGRFLIYWNSFYSNVASVVSTAVLLGFAIRILNGHQTIWIQLVRQFVLLLAVGLGVVFCFGLLDFSFNLENRFQPPWIDYPAPVSLAFWSAGISAALFVSYIFKNWNAEKEAWFFVWIIWSILAVACSFSVVGASYLFVVPVVFAVVARTVCIMFRLSFANSNLIAAIVAGAVLLPIGVLFYEALGFSANVVACVRCGLMCTTLLPILAATSRSVLAGASWVMLAITVVSTLVSVLLNHAG